MNNSKLSNDSGNFNSSLSNSPKKWLVKLDESSQKVSPMQRNEEKRRLSATAKRELLKKDE